MVPFARPILTLTVLTFADSWNEFFLALVFTINRATAPAGLASFSGRYDDRRPHLGGRGDRRPPGRDRLRHLPARVHARHADRCGEGLSDGACRLRRGHEAVRRGHGAARLLAAYRRRGSWCSSARRARQTTALRLLAGLEAVTEEMSVIGDRVVDRLAPRGRDIAMVFQDYALYPQKSVYDNLAFGLRMRKMPRGDRPTRPPRRRDARHRGAAPAQAACPVG